MAPSTFYADAVLFDMDGTLTDSIAAVEAAWGAVAAQLGLDPAHVIAATHGKRAVDNLRAFRPELARAGAAEMEAEVERFERMILDFADAGAGAAQPQPQTQAALGAASGCSTPALSNASATPFDSVTTSEASSRADSFSIPTPAPAPGGAERAHRPSFATRLSSMLTLVGADGLDVFDDASDAAPAAQAHEQDQAKQLAADVAAAWEAEAEAVDRSVRILPGVRRMLDSIPEGRYAVATSGAKTYAHGCMARVGITPPAVTITADDARLLAGKPAPDPFLLAAACLGVPAHRCVVFEDSPSGIAAGRASGAVVVAVCTSHPRAAVEKCGAHYVVGDMESISCEVVTDGEGERLRFTVA